MSDECEVYSLIEWNMISIPRGNQNFEKRTRQKVAQQEVV